MSKKLSTWFMNDPKALFVKTDQRGGGVKMSKISQHSLWKIPNLTPKLHSTPKQISNVKYFMVFSIL